MEGPPKLPRRIEWRIRAAMVLLTWERLWPAMWPATSMAGIFIALALLGTFTNMAPSLHWTILAGFALAMTASLWHGLLDFRRPTRADAMRQIEKASGLTHQPLSAFEDDAARGTGDVELWVAHRAWVNDKLKHLRLGWPEPGVSAADPLALRAGVLLVIIVAFYGSGPGRIDRLSEAFMPGIGAMKTLSLEAWLTPPGYTGIPPIYLDQASETDAADRVPVSVPTGTVLSLRVTGLKNPPALENMGSGRGHPEEMTEIADRNYTLDTPLSESADYALTQGGRLIRAWPLTVTPDTPPKIDFTAPIEETTRGTLNFKYALQDDYGIASAQAVIALDKAMIPDGMLPPTSLDTLIMPKVTPPEVALTLPRQRTRKGDGQSFADLSSHPWAGLPVTITLVARDDLGQEGRSTAYAMVLPARKFTKPLARAIIEQRQRLALDPRSVGSVARFIDDFSRDGEKYIQDTTVYLTLRAAYWRLSEAHRDEDLTGIFDLLWDIALRIEDGELSLAENDLRKARDELAEALKNGAGSDVIDRLMNELKDAFNRYMEALAEQADKMGADMTQTPFSPQNMQTIERQQLEAMMKQIEQLARTGAREQAEAMLKQLQQIMENMQTPQQAGTMSEGEQAMSEAIDKIGELIDQQRALMDETFRQQPGPVQEGEETSPTGEGGEGAEGGGKASHKPGEGNAEALAKLQADQKALREQLDALMKELGSKGEKAPDSLSEAGQSMKNAEDRLEAERADRAAAAQGQAIDQMRAGAQGLADKLMQGMAGRMGNSGRGNGMAQGSDPLGRSTPNGTPQTGSEVAVPDKIEAERARDIIEELRRRATKLGRPKIELEYIDRLLKRF
ncbi:MAG: TIGR02302 family protein [Rhizobiales bacterium]|nr:TIGR02302 family protein [Hyphomicrobiales bacterium]